MPRLLKGPPLPKYGEEIWDLFCQLTSSRRAGARLGFLDIAAYCAVTRTPLSHWEIEALYRLEAAMFNPQDHTEDP